MEETGGFFEEMNSEDCEEVELSAKEEEYECIADFKESAVSDEVDGILKESGYEDGVGSYEVLGSEDDVEAVSGSGNIKVIYVNRSSVQNNKESVSDNQVVLLDPAQFEILIDELSSLKTEPVEVQTVSMNDYTEELHKLQETSQGTLLVVIVLFGLCFGYFVKESIFRGN